jgi:hypothetical protein
MYAELVCRSNFSFLHGASHPEELVAASLRLGQSAKHSLVGFLITVRHYLHRETPSK